MDNSSKAIIVYQEKILLLLRDNIPTIPEPNKWHLPGGGVEKGETFEQTIRRELEEEILMVPKELIYLGMFEASESQHALYYSRITNPEFEKIHLGDEGQALNFFTLEEARNLPLVFHLEKMMPKVYSYLLDVISKNGVPNPLSLYLK